MKFFKLINILAIFGFYEYYRISSYIQCFLQREECVETWNLRKENSKSTRNRLQKLGTASPAQHHNTTRQTYIKHKQKKKGGGEKKEKKKKGWKM